MGMHKNKRRADRDKVDGLQPATVRVNLLDKQKLRAFSANRIPINYFGKCSSLLALFLLLAVVSCATPQEKSVREGLTLTPASFGDLDGWQNDAPGQALIAFRHSCATLEKKDGKTSMGIAGKVAAWQWACAAADRTPEGDDAARAYFEQWFRPFAAAGREGDTGLFTGYYAPELSGSLQQGGAFQTPLYARPADLIAVDLGLFKSSLKGQHIVGKVEGSKLTLYDNRASIARGSLNGRAQPLVWLDDPVSAFFLEIQGSGHVRLADGSVIPVGYDGANGRDYVAIGRIMADRGDLPRPVTMPAIRAWLAAHPDQAQQVMNENPSYVFFRKLPEDKVVGAEGVELTPERSIAVDPSFVALGVPVWLDTTDGNGAPLRRLTVAQDTGGAIKGAVRADFFWGSGDAAAAQAGAMQSRGRYYLLLPKTVNPSED
jgi:membrane-bound lytic murein transglycosylase A